MRGLRSEMYDSFARLSVGGGDPNPGSQSAFRTGQTEQTGSARRYERPVRGPDPVGGRSRFSNDEAAAGPEEAETRAGTLPTARTHSRKSDEENKMHVRSYIHNTSPI